MSSETKVIELRPNPRPLAHGKYEQMAVRMGIHGDNAAQAYRHVMGLAENEPVPSTANFWAQREEVKARVKHLRMEMARREQERVLIDRNQVVQRLWDVADAAKEEGKHTAELKALELLGKDAGMFKGIESPKSVEDMPDDKLAKEFQRLMEEAAKSGSRSEGSAAGYGEGAEESQAPELPTLP